MILAPLRLSVEPSLALSKRASQSFLTGRPRAISPPPRRAPPRPIISALRAQTRPLAPPRAPRRPATLATHKFSQTRGFARSPRRTVRTGGAPARPPVAKLRNITAGGRLNFASVESQYTGGTSSTPRSAANPAAVHLHSDARKLTKKRMALRDSRTYDNHMTTTAYATSPPSALSPAADAEALRVAYEVTRRATEELCSPLEPEDYVIQ